MSWHHSSPASAADELRSGSFRAVFEVFIDGSWKRPSECGRTVSSGGVNYIVGRPNLFYRVVLHNDHPEVYYTCDVRPDGQEHSVKMSYILSPGSSRTVSSWRMDPEKAVRGEHDPKYAFKFGDIPEAPHGSAGAKSGAPGMSAAAAQSPGNLGKVLIIAAESERYTVAPHTVTFTGGSPASSSVAPGVGLKKAQTKFGIHTAAPQPTGYAAPHLETRDHSFRVVRALPHLAFEYRDEVALCIAGILKSVPGAQLSGAKRSAAAAGLSADIKPDIKPDVKPSLAVLKSQAAAARAARAAAGSLPGGDEDEEEDEEEDSDEDVGSSGRGGRAAGGAARRGGAAASQSIAVVSLLHDEEAGAGKGGRRQRENAGAAADALPTFEETRIVRVVAAGGVSKGIREVLIPVLPAGTGLGYSEGADGALCLDDDDDDAAGAAAGAGGSGSRSAKPGKAAAAATASDAAGAVCPMPWYRLPHLLAAAQAALDSEDSHSSRLRALDAAKALAEATLQGPASTTSSGSSSSSSSAGGGGPAGQVWTHSGAAVTSIAQALSQGSGLPLVVAFGPSPAFKPMQDIHTAV